MSSVENKIQADIEKGPAIRGNASPRHGAVEAVKRPAGQQGQDGKGVKSKGDAKRCEEAKSKAREGHLIGGIAPVLDLQALPGQ